MTLLDDSHMTDPGLVAEVRLGRREAFGELYRRYYSGALRYALSITRGDEAHAQDIVSEAFTRVFRAMSRNCNVSAFWPYLLASVRNAHRAELRRSVRVDLVERPDDLDDLVPEVPSDSDQDPGIRAAFRRLPPRWQTVLWRTEICGDTAAEIGQDLGISANAAAALALRAREGLRVQYLQHRLEYSPRGCRPYAEHLARLVRGVLGRRDRRHVEAHLRGCKDCQRAVAELTALNSRMRSVLPLILGVWPFASGQGMSIAPAGSGLLGPAGAAATGVAGTAGITGGTTGAVGLAAIGVGHVGAVAGLAVASVVAVLGLPTERSLDADSQPSVASVVPDHGVVHDSFVGTHAEPLAEPLAEGTEAEPPAEQAPLDTGLMMAPPSEPALSDESVTASGGTDADAGIETADTTGLTEGDSLTGAAPDVDAASPQADSRRPTDPGSEADNGGGPESRDAEPFGLSSPAVVPAKPDHAAQPARSGPAQPAQPPKKQDKEDSTPEPPTQPIPAATPANTGPAVSVRPAQAPDSAGSGQRGRPEDAGRGGRTPPDVGHDTDVTQVTSVGRHAYRGSRISRLQAFTRQR
ncbi:MAG TPA: sigma-70 family RNA polymerase sigma factor [Jiangellaceae bacterium]